MVETQGGEVLEVVELADDRAHQFSHDHDEGRGPALDAPAGHRNLKLGPLLARRSLECSVPVPDMPALFDIPNPAAHFARIALILQALTPVLAQLAKSVDVVHEDTPRRPVGRFRPVVPPECLGLVGRWILVSHRARTYLASMHCSSAADD